MEEIDIIKGDYVKIKACKLHPEFNGLKGTVIQIIKNSAGIRLDGGINVFVELPELEWIHS